MDQPKLARLFRDDRRFTVLQTDGYDLLRGLLEEAPDLPRALSQLALLVSD